MLVLWRRAELSNAWPSMPGCRCPAMSRSRSNGRSKRAPDTPRSRGWEVVATFIDDGVSATHNKPEARAGWRALLDADERYDAVIVWKIDRLARRVIDFLHADEALQQRQAGLSPWKTRST